MPKLRTSSSTRRRRGTKAQTRERLIQSALDLLETGGEAAVTTISVTARAGIVQSAFYLHFANVEECLAVVAERITNELRKFVADTRRARLETPSHTATGLEEAYRNMFKLASRQRSIHRLFLRYRSDRLALNGVMYRFARGLSADLAKDLAHRAVQAGCQAAPAEWIAAVADHLVAMSLSAIEAHLDRRGPPPEESARLLATFTHGAWKAVLETMQTRSCGGSG